MPLAKSRRFGAVVATRYRDGTCTATCNRSNCRAYAEPRGWRRTVRLASEHAAAHAHTDAHDVDTPWGIPAYELPQAARKPRRHLAAVAVVLLLAALAFSVTVVSVAGQAGSKPAPTTSTTTTPAPYEYIPTPAGLPATSNARGGR
jgi:hypothetical protein